MAQKLGRNTDYGDACLRLYRACDFTPAGRAAKIRERGEAMLLSIHINAESG
jgi:hypothetical protein